MTLADTPATWLDGPSESGLRTLAVFVGIPLLVILTIFLLTYAPSWVHGPRYRPGQPWEAETERFGTPIIASTPTGLLGVGAQQTAEADEGDTTVGDRGSGGASAGW